MLAISGAALVAYALFAPGSTQAPADASAAGLLTIEPSDATVRREEGRGPARELEFTLRNSSDATVRILGVIPRCECTLVEALPISQLAPGEQASLRVAVEIPETGGRKTSIDVFTDSTVQPIVTAQLRLVGEGVEAPYVIEQPRNVDLVVAAGNSAASAELSIRTLELGEEPWLTALEARDPSIRTELVAIGIEREFDSIGAVWRHYVFRVSVDRGTDASDWTTTLVAGSEIANGERLAALNIRVKCLPVIEAVPSRLVFNTRSGALATEQTVALRAHVDDEWAVTGLTTSDPGLQVKMVAGETELSDGGSTSFVIAVSVGADISAPDNAVTMKVLVETDHPLQPTIEVPVLLAGP